MIFKNKLFYILLVIFVMMISGCGNTKTNETVKWHENNIVIAHALGNVDGRSETNSLEALHCSYERGFKVFEVDISLTSDGYLALRHDFEETSYYNFEQTPSKKSTVMNKDTFLSSKINGIYTPILFENLVDFMVEHEDVYIVTDTKNIDKETVTMQFKKIKEIVDATGKPEIYDRIIVQLYHYDMIEWVNKVNKFDNYIITLYQMQDIDYEYLGKYCKDNKIDVVTMPEVSCKPEISETLHKYGLKVYAHTINRIKTLDSLNKYFYVDGFYTDFISPDDLNKFGYVK